MKKKKLKLSLNKMTVAKINDATNIKGGAGTPTEPPTVGGPSIEYCPTREECLSPNPCNVTVECKTIVLHTVCVG